MSESRENKRFLPGIAFPEGLRVEADPFAAAEACAVLSQRSQSTPPRAKAMRRRARAKRGTNRYRRGR